MFWHFRCIIFCDACTTARTSTTAWAVYASGVTTAAVNCYFDRYVDTVGICVWPFLLIPPVEDRWENIYPLSPSNTPVNDFCGDSNAETAAISSGFWNLALNPATWQMAMQFIILMSASHMNYNRDIWHSFNVHVFIPESMYFLILYTV